MVKCLKSKKPLDCHLMIENPAKYIPDFIAAGADYISTHIELGEDSVNNCINLTQSAGVKAGVVINPATPVEKIFSVLNKVDYVLVMSVVPGFGGQSFMSEVLEKVKIIRSKKPDLEIQIDGGINSDTAKLAIEAGANNLVAGSYIFKSENRIETIKSLKNMV